MLLNNCGILDFCVSVLSSLDGGMEGVEIAYLDLKFFPVVLLPNSFLIEEGFDREMEKIRAKSKLIMFLLSTFIQQPQFFTCAYIW